MKKISIIALAMMLLTACEKDVFSDHPQPASTSGTPAERSQVTRPMKVSFHSSVDPSSPTLTCTLPGVPFAIANSGYFLHGHATHFGKIDAEQSKGLDGFCNLNGNFILTTQTAGQIVAANGDKITYTGDDVIDLNNYVFNGATTAAFTGLWTITGGTGKYAGATGSFTVNGYVDLITVTIHITGEGSITY